VFPSGRFHLERWMALRGSELRQVMAEVDARLRGAVVQKAHAPLPRICFLELRIPGRSIRLCLSAEPGLARISVAHQRLPSPDAPPPFQRWLRQELIGARLTRADALEGSARLVFERQGVERAVAVELRGARSNLFLLDGASRVLAASLPEGEHARPGARWESAAPAVSPGEENSRLVPVAGAELPFAEAAEALLGPREHAKRATEIRRRLLKPLEAKRARIERTRDKVRAEAKRQPEAERHREAGELLAQNLFRIPRGTRSVRLTRYTEAGTEEVEIALDPSRTPKEQADWHFHQYRRLLRGCEHARRRLAELEAERSEIDARIAAIQAREDDELASDAQLLLAPRRRGPERARPYKEFLAQGGARILVGKSSAGNDALTFRIARPHDVWLHARGVPGSHVVLEVARGADVPQEALIDAAHLAHHFSQRKGEPRGEVAWTEVKFVRRMKGGAAGQVTFIRDRTLVVRVEPARLERLLRSSGEDRGGASA
jgi:predicted ribosome quality control (RQC) complex YloA/Tae2 family protein